MPVFITKISSVVRITTDTNVPKIYFSPQGSAGPAQDGVTVNMKVGSDMYSVKYTDLRIGTAAQTPVNMVTAITLLNSIFGT